jgi:predicted GNAT family N-acyltransferase
LTGDTTVQSRNYIAMNASKNLGIRLALPEDITLLASLVNKAYRPNGNPLGWTHEAQIIYGDRISIEQLKELFRDQSAILTLEKEGEIVACVHIEKCAGYSQIGMLATNPKMQANGIGSKMLCAAEDFADKQFYTKLLRISVLAPRSELLRFYQRRSYALTGQSYQYPIDDGIGNPLVSDLQVVTLEKLLR